MAGCAAIASGCGDDAAEGGGESAGLESEPARLVTKIARTAGSAKTKKDCKEVAEVNLRSPVKIVCPPLTDQMRTANRSVRVTAAATYGFAAAVVDYRSRGARDGASIVLYRNPKGEWTIRSWGLLYGETVGTDDDESRDESSDIVARYIQAVRDGDCETFSKVTATQSADPDKACKLEFPKALARALRRSPDSRPRYVGGNEDLHFYSLDLENPSRTYTIATVKTAEGALRPRLVLAYAPTPADEKSG